MKERRKFIINAGGWYVGNSAILEWLNAFPHTCYIKGDLDLFREKGGIFDLIFSVEKNKDVDLAIKNLKRLVLQKIILIFKYRLANATKYFFSSFKYKFDNHERRLAFCLRLLNKISNFNKLKSKSDVVYDFWREWIVSEAKLLNRNKLCQYIVLQNPFYYREFSPKHDHIWRRLFHSRKVVFVCRDHADQFKTIRDEGQLLHTKDSKFRSGTENFSERDRFFYLNTRLYNSRINFKEYCSDGELMVLEFEKFVSRDEDKRLRSFLGLGDEEVYFDFEFSKKNIGIAHRDKFCTKFYLDNLEEFRALDRLKKKLLES